MANMPKKIRAGWNAPNNLIMTFFAGSMQNFPNCMHIENFQSKTKAEGVFAQIFQTTEVQFGFKSGLC